ncbi:unnamed protein product [Camellia sinensis]
MVVFRERKEKEEGDGEEEMVGLVVFIHRKEEEGDGEEEVVGLVCRFEIPSRLNLYLRSLWVCKFSFCV